MAYFSKRKLKPKEEEEMGELNIVPYLDILMNLIIFMLLSMTGLATFGIVNINAPSYSAGGGSGATPDEKPPLLLTVAVSSKGFFLAATGGVLPFAQEAASGAAPAGDAPPTVPVKANGEYDYAMLTERMKQIKASFPTETKVILAADAQIPYEVVVATLDATRETADRKLLFPDVTLASF